MPRLDFVRSVLAKKLHHAWACVKEHPDVALWFGQRSRTPQRPESNRGISSQRVSKLRLQSNRRLQSKRLQDEDFDQAACSPTFFRCFQQALQQPHCLKKEVVFMVALIASQEHPG